MSQQSELEENFWDWWLLLARDQPVPKRQYKFHPVRRWKFDFAWDDDYKLAVEIDGGMYVNGRHNRPAGYEADCEKLNTAIIEGWRVLRYTGGMLKRDPAGVIEQVKQALAKAA